MIAHTCFKLTLVIKVLAKRHFSMYSKKCYEAFLVYHINAVFQIKCY